MTYTNLVSDGMIVIYVMGHFPVIHIVSERLHRISSTSSTAACASAAAPPWGKFSRVLKVITGGNWVFPYQILTGVTSFCNTHLGNYIYSAAPFWPKHIFPAEIKKMAQCFIVVVPVRDKE